MPAARFRVRTSTRRDFCRDGRERGQCRHDQGRRGRWNRHPRRKRCGDRRERVSGGLISAGQFGISADNVTLGQQCRHRGVHMRRGCHRRHDRECQQFRHAPCGGGERRSGLHGASSCRTPARSAVLPAQMAIFSSGQADVVNCRYHSRRRNAILTGGALNLTNMAGGIIAGTIDGVFARAIAVIINAGSITGGPLGVSPPTPRQRRPIRHHHRQ